ncbi:EcsC family protein [Pseudoblastomonas halimionae]|uniref:EcsC family protein n=1 Tax=Alteriqipengyuania halimionae TaxID=1926630 RepID=A0A6I4U5Z2_9SPHN|nr:EcsC family protein [Alteriqipengyuania halimionae]MXP09861.1 EcsC family protein [Alteriqipengyuania halimionae]
MNIDREIAQYRKSKPSMLGRGIERLTHPFGKALSSVVPDALVEGVLKGLDQAVGAPALNRFDHDPADLDAAHDAAKGIVRTARNISTTTGAAAGFGGALSMSFDIPATIGIALRTIRDTGRAYGFDGEGAAERVFRLQILELSALDEPELRDERIAALEAAIAEDGSLVAADHKDITPIVDQAVERVSRAIAFASFRSRAGMVVPVVGSAVGALVNRSFQGDVGEAARFAFLLRRRKQDGDTVAA